MSSTVTLFYSMFETLFSNSASEPLFIRLIGFLLFTVLLPWLLPVTILADLITLLNPFTYLGLLLDVFR